MITDNDGISDNELSDEEDIPENINIPQNETNKVANLKRDHIANHLV